MDIKSVLIIKGSHRENGFTNRMCNEIAKVFSSCSVKIFDACNERFSPCTGCNYCEKNGCCVFRDLDSFYESFETADLIVFSSPVYNGNFSAPIKALIDRFQVYYTGFYANKKTQQIKKHRKAFFLAAAGRGGEKSFSYLFGKKYVKLYKSVYIILVFIGSVNPPKIIWEFALYSGSTT